MKEQGLARTTSASEISQLLFSSSGFKYVGQLLLIGCFIFIAIPSMLAQFGIDRSVAFATVFAVINFHHFLTDQAIWKLRDPAVKANLTT